MSYFLTFWDNLVFIGSHLRAQDLIDILLVWIVIYKILMIIRRSGTVQILSGLGILAITYILSIWFEFFTMNWLLEKLFSNLFVILVVLFQAEIRRALAQIGSHPLLTDVSVALETHVVEEIAKGIVTIAQKGYGALIVIEKDIMVDYFVEMGTEMDSRVSSEILVSIFHPQAPMHDGAVLIRSGKIASAGCFLPLSKNPALDKNLGTRHRAALGLTEETDALVIVVSEESQSISIVSSGHMRPHAEMVDLRKALFEAFGLKYKIIHESGSREN